MSEVITTLADVRAALVQVYNATDLNSLRRAFIDFGIVARDYDACQDNGTDVSEWILDHHRVPEFVTESAPKPPYHISAPWWSRDDERVLVGFTFDEHDMYFVDYNGDRI